jgi:hypothetical protein
LYRNAIYSASTGSFSSGKEMRIRFIFLFAQAMANSLPRPMLAPVINVYSEFVFIGFRFLGQVALL